MIIGSIALVVVSAALWLIGLRESSDLWYYASIVGSVLAAFALLVGVRRRSWARIPDDDFDIDTLHPSPDLTPLAPRPTGRASVPRQSATARLRPGVAQTSATTGPGDSDRPDAGELISEPPDEPPPQVITEREAGRVADLTDEVVVVDGRPRYHAAGCQHLLGRESERLPVNEAVQLGFTPCGHCEPVRGLLATRPRP